MTPLRIMLHDHLDGSRTLLPILPELYRMARKTYRFSGSLGEQYQAVKRFFNDPSIDIVVRFGLVTNVLQSREALMLAAKTYACERAKEGFEYCEATIAPQYHQKLGLTIPEVMEALVDGVILGESEYPGIEVNLLPSIGREIEPDEALVIVDELGECDPNYVVGVGLVCCEPGNPPEKHARMFRRAKMLGFSTTCHAGEWVSDLPDYAKDGAELLANVQSAVRIGVDRIGHAIPLGSDPKLMKEVIRYGIGIEGCPASNLASEYISDVGVLRIRDMLNTGVLYSINPDDDLFLPSQEETFALCDATYHFTPDEIAKLEMNAWRTRFGCRKNGR